MFPYTCNGLLPQQQTIPDTRWLDFQSLNNRINALHEHKLRQIDENRKISGRVDELRDFTDRETGNLAHLVEHAEDGVEKCFERIEKLEEKISEKYAHPDVIGRLEKLESGMKMLSAEFFSIKESYHVPIEKMVEENVNQIWRKIDEIEKGSVRLESLINIEQAQKIIMDGANLHASILKFETQMKELQKRMNSFDLIPSMKKVVCPGCNGKGLHLVVSVAYPCRACDEKGFLLQ